MTDEFSFPFVMPDWRVVLGAMIVGGLWGGLTYEVATMIPTLTLWQSVLGGALACALPAGFMTTIVSSG